MIQFTQPKTEGVQFAEENNFLNLQVDDMYDKKNADVCTISMNKKRDFT